MHDLTIHCYLGGDPGRQLVDGKFVQLRWRDRDHVVFADFAQCRYHNQIVERFARAHDIACQWISREELECYEDGFTVRGGGRFRDDRRARELVLHDSSHAYGRFVDDDLGRRLAIADGPWRGYRVRIA